MNKDTLLVELGTEELPPKSLRKLAEGFYEGITTELKSNDIEYSSAKWFASPRRLAVLVENASVQQESKVVEKKGPSVSAAYDAEGNPSKAAQGWARSNGIDVSQASTLKTDKGEWLFYKAEVEGKPLSDLIQDILDKALKRIPIAKAMRWGSNKVSFIRPVHKVTVLHGQQVLEAKVLGLESNNKILGHRFHSQGEISLTSASQYLDVLKAHFVIADFNERKKLIQDQIQSITAELQAQAVYDDSLLEEVASLVEWPVALVASFDEKFLDVPKEALIYTMKDDQKYFPLVDSNGNLLNKFIFITNIESKDVSQVVKGNEKVVTPRLADAEFFFQQDKKATLESRLESLKSVTFQQQLGSVYERCQRISSLAENIASSIGANASQAARGGLLAKADLASNMVLEFPEVQGVMGQYYAQHDGEAANVSQSIREHYLPRFAGDVLPQTQEGVAVSLADKVDLMVGIFGVGMIPKGDKDPFALRRAAIGLLRMCIELKLELDLEKVVEVSIAGFGDKLTNLDVKSNVLEFITSRYMAYFLDQSIATDVIQAVSASTDGYRPLDFSSRVSAVVDFKNQAQSGALSQSNKRVANILAKQKDAIVTSHKVVENSLSEDAEKALFTKLSAVEKEVEPLIAKQEYSEMLITLCSMEEEINRFFEDVMVMSDNDVERQNRLAILQQLRLLFTHVADVSVLK